ncbi:hypothetical protein MCOR04_008608 [Pyricularia oryzae]|nr:hypothetical protein MCOR04_008608 [Pyricularia oryzae]
MWRNRSELGFVKQSRHGSSGPFGRERDKKKRDSRRVGSLKREAAESADIYIRKPLAEWVNRVGQRSSSPGVAAQLGSEQTGDHSFFVNKRCKGLKYKREKAGELSKSVNGLPAFPVCFEPSCSQMKVGMINTTKTGIIGERMGPSKANG